MTGPEELATRFTHHPPQGDQPRRYSEIRDAGLAGLALAEIIDVRCPDSQEKSLALTSIEQAIMWANAAIARRE